jgi:hypothetical protein
MTTLVYMMKLDAATGHRDRFSCSVPAWELLLDLGQTFGWKPKGTTYDAGKSRPDIDRARHNYEPGERKDKKWVDVEDAEAWARALRSARDSTHLDTLIGLRPERAAHSNAATAEDTMSTEAPFAAVLDEFIEYAATGAFAFACNRNL